ncbi:hypothetical protein [Brevibacterium linens]|uniref:hypothetical protein n=1 Tax=Brevibacterium linens TaxID=1703 RepID=UPI000FCA95D0|nr:hypothetical protein [Brevibacterium linens]AZU01593.1 hypothetical protein CXR29_13550 [Brevibacterium linens]
MGCREDARAANLWQLWTRDDIDFATGRTDLTVAELAEALGRSVSSIEECLRKYGTITTNGTVLRRA